MSKLPLLKTLASILFFISMIGMFFSIPFLFILSVMPDRVPFKFAVKGVEEGAKVNAELILYILALIIGYGFFTYALYLFRKILDLFSKKIIFDRRVVISLHQCGNSILIGYFICIGAEFLYKILTRQEIEIKLNFGLDGSIAIISLALFFIVLAEVFHKAKKLQEENDLTV